MIVAVLFILSGILSVMAVVGALVQSGLYLDWGVLGLFVGFGLLRLRSGWRTCGLILLWADMIGSVVFAVLILGDWGPLIRGRWGSLDLWWWGQVMGEVQKEIVVPIVGVMFLLALWQYLVLTSRDVKELFAVTVTPAPTV